MSSMTRFLSTPSARRATRRYIRRKACCRDFYPRPPRGGRRMGFPSSFTSSIFLSTPSARRATTDAYKESGTYLFLSTPSARRATLCRVYRSIRRDISIHALREEGDLGGVEEPSSSATISIHALREEGDERRLKTQILFTDFYPRPPRGGRRKNLDQWDGLLQFLSTPSARRATIHRGRRHDEKPISIHALREEGDAFKNSLSASFDDFYPRPPRGGRLFKPITGNLPESFLSTPSARRATKPS